MDRARVVTRSTRLAPGVLASVVGLCAACNVEPLGGDTGGVPAGEGGPCPDGVSIVLGDFRSSQVALSTVDGLTQSESLLSSGSVTTKGLSFALSGDVVLPKTRPASGRVVLLDRFGTNVVTWVDPTSGRVLGQLPVGTGFQSNPQDYIEVDDRRAYVSRLGHNLLAGAEAFDEGSDVLVLDTEAPRISGRIALPSSRQFPARPGGFARLDADTVLLILGRLSVDLQSADTAMLLALDTPNDAIAWQLELEGLKNCGTPRLSPNAERLAIACAGPLTREGESLEVHSSGLVVLDARVRPPRELRRFSGMSLAGGPIQSELAFTSDERLLLKSQTAVGAETGNRLLELTLSSGEVRVLLEVDSESSGDGIAFGSVLCAPGCASYCLLANTSDSTVVRLRLQPDGAAELTDARRVEHRIGLPPASLCYR